MIKSFTYMFKYLLKCDFHYEKKLQHTICKTKHVQIFKNRA